MKKIIMLVLVVVVLSGCSGEMYLGARRIDTYRQEQRMTYKPYKCLFVDCPSLPAAPNANEPWGS